jgi:hypothetical protein
VTDMHTPDHADCTDCALDPCEEHAELGRELVRQFVRQSFAPSRPHSRLRRYR